MTEVDQILAHATVVTMDPEYRVIPDGAIAIQDGSILNVGSAPEILASHSASEVVDCGGKVMINMRDTTETSVKCPCSNINWNLELKK